MSSRDRLMPEDFPGYDWARSDREADAADAANDEAALDGLTEVRVAITDELIGALIDATATDVPPASRIELEALLLQMRLARRVIARRAA